MTDWGDAVAAFIRWQGAAGRATGTLKLRVAQLGRLERAHPGRGPWDLDAEDLVAWLARPGWSGSTRRSHRAAVRSFYGWAASTGRVEANPAGSLPSVPSRRGKPRPADEQVVAAAYRTADDRDALMIRCGRDAGLRACEIATLHTANVWQDLDGWTVTVTGKGGKLRDVPLSPRLALALRARPAGWVFPGRIDGHLSAAYVSKRLSWALGAGTTGHQLRHRFASAAYAAERDIRAVQDLLGHASPETTAIYTEVPDQARRRAVLAARSEGVERPGHQRHQADGGEHEADGLGREDEARGVVEDLAPVHRSPSVIRFGPVGPGVPGAGRGG